MAQISKAELEEVFVDVRKSYRLLYFYQRRILDTVKFIADTIYKNLDSGWSNFEGNPPKDGDSIDLNASAWDWLSMYSYEFFFELETKGEDTYRFAIAVQSDSGYWDKEGSIAKSSVERFGNVETSVTKIYFHLGVNRWKPDPFDDVWVSKANDEFLLKEQRNIFLSKRFDLSDFIDDESILQKLHEVKFFFESNGVKDFFVL